MKWIGEDYDLANILKGTYRENDPTAYMVGDRVLSIVYRKGQTHYDCDAECLSKNHIYEHKFSARRQLPLIGFRSDDRTEF